MAKENNDSRILTMKEQIAKKKKEISKAKRFSPVTNCSIELDGIRTNINTLNKDQLIQLLVKLKSYQMAAEELYLLKEYVISGYLIDEWLEDLKSKLLGLSQKEEENKLKQMEQKLDTLLSNDKKTELEIDDIANMLK